MSTTSSPLPYEENEIASNKQAENALSHLNLEDTLCPLCNESYKQPRILDCLHVFCTKCLEKEIDESCDGLEIFENNNKIICSICEQITSLQNKAVVDLPLDTVLASMVDISAFDDMHVVCTSCKAREKAVAQCQDCANFLCPNCVTAHQYMRCFENHKVVSFDELQNGESLSLHKPIFCSTHNSEVLKFYCTYCQEPLCNECIVSDHKSPEHRVERVSDIESKQLDDLRMLITESRNKMKMCKNVAVSLENYQQDLQMQRDDATDSIKETFQTYKVVLENCMKKLLSELSDMHRLKRGEIWEMSHDVNKMIDRIEDGCKFIERILQHGSSVEILGYKKVICSQMLSLINNKLNADIAVKLEFITDSSTFESSVEKTFGYLKEEKNESPDLLDSVENSLVSSLPSIDNLSFHGVISTPTQMDQMPDFLTSFTNTIPPISIGNFSGSSISPATILTNSDAINSLVHTLPPLSSERSSSRNSYSPAMSDSGISVDAGSTGSVQQITSQQPPVIDIIALSKIGAVNVNSQGLITLNGHAIPGLNVNNIGVISNSITSRAQTPTPTSESGNLSDTLRQFSL